MSDFERCNRNDGRSEAVAQFANWLMEDKKILVKK